MDSNLSALEIKKPRKYITIYMPNPIVERLCSQFKKNSDTYGTAITRLMDRADYEIVGDEIIHKSML